MLERKTRGDVSFSRDRDCLGEGCDKSQDVGSEYHSQDMYMIAGGQLLLAPGTHPWSSLLHKTAMAATQPSSGMEILTHASGLRYCALTLVRRERIKGRRTSNSRSYEPRCVEMGERKGKVKSEEKACRSLDWDRSDRAAQSTPLIHHPTILTPYLSNLIRC